MISLTLNNIDLVCIICKLLLIILDFSAINVINVLGGRSMSSSHTLRWVQPKVFLFLIEPIKFVVDLFDDLTLMKL